RIDSGDLGAHAHAVRRILDAGGLERCTIFASGGIDEDALARLAASGAPIDGFGVGTRLDTSADAPYLDCAYKLQEYGGRPRRKRSEGKATWPGQKQVFRKRAADGLLVEDVGTLVGDSQPGEPLVVPVMRGGRRRGGAPRDDSRPRRSADPEPPGAAPDARDSARALPGAHLGAAPFARGRARQSRPSRHLTAPAQREERARSRCDERALVGSRLRSRPVSGVSRNLRKNRRRPPAAASGKCDNRLTDGGERLTRRSRRIPVGAVEV